MAMNKMLQLGLLAGGGFLVYSYLMQEEESIGPIQILDKLLGRDGNGNGGELPNGGNGNGAPSDVNGGNGTPPSRVLSLFDQIKAMEIQSTGSNVMNFDQHNWFYSQISGIPGPSPESVGIVRTDPMADIPIEGWWKATGLSGIYLGPAVSSGLGFTAARPSRWERATKEFGV